MFVFLAINFTVTSVVCIGYCCDYCFGFNDGRGI